jgi:hypothetical protein
MYDVQNARSSYGIPVLGSEIALHHPNTLTQPRYKFEVISSTSKQRLSCVHMGRNQTRANNATSQIDFFFINMLDFQLAGGTNVGYFVALATSHIMKVKL